MQSDLRRMDAVIQNLEREGDYTVGEIMDSYRNVMTDNTIVAFAEKLATALDTSGHFRTAKAYRCAAARLHAFSGMRLLNFEHLTAHLLGDFQQALKAEGRSMNTVSFYMRTLRSIYHKAVAEGRVGRRTESLFAGVYTGVSATRKLALTHAELAMLSAFDPTEGGVKTRQQQLPDYLGEALAMFLFCYHARGMCFVDMANLKKSDLVGGTIRYRRSKTGQRIEVKVLPAMRRIIDWFARRGSGSRYMFPILDEKRGDINLQYESGLRLQNMHLKKIAARCGISKRLSTHCARHSWATVAKSAGLPLAVISEGLGHSNQRTTEIYLASLERSILDQAAEMVSEAIYTSRKPGRGRHGAASARAGGGGTGGLPAGLPNYGGLRV
jgi:integrase